VRRNGKFEFLLCNWGADYSDPETETDPFYQAKDSRGMRYAYLRTGVEDGFITGETADAVMAYMNAIEAAKQITDDIDARYKAFADAEALLITNALVIPRGRLSVAAASSSSADRPTVRTVRYGTVRYVRTSFVRLLRPTTTTTTVPYRTYLPTYLPTYRTVPYRNRNRNRNGNR